MILWRIHVRTMALKKCYENFYQWQRIVQPTSWLRPSMSADHFHVGYTGASSQKTSKFLNFPECSVKQKKRFTKYNAQHPCSGSAASAFIHQLLPANNVKKSEHGCSPPVASSEHYKKQCIRADFFLCYTNFLQCPYHASRGPVCYASFVS